MRGYRDRGMYLDTRPERGKTMKIQVWTKQSRQFMKRASRRLIERGYGSDLASQLLQGQVDGERVRFEGLSLAQFNAVEDTAAWMGLQYDGRQDA